MAICLLGGANFAWGTESGTIDFSAKSRCSYNTDTHTYTTDNNAGNGYALAVADLSSLPNIASATSVTLEFNVVISGRLLIGIGDKSVRGTNANGSSKTTYNTEGLVMRYGTTDDNYVRVNGGTNNSNALNVTSHVSFTLNRKTGKYSYTITNAAGTETFFSDTNVSTSVSNATIVEAYSWANSQSNALSAVSYSYELESYNYSVTAKDSEGNTLKENLISGTSSDGVDVTVDCPHAFQESGVWYVKSNTTYSVSINHFNNNLSVIYAADPSIVYYCEGENLNSSTASAGLSNGAYGHVNGGSGSSNKGKSIGSFSAGIYKATACFVSNDVERNRGFYIRNSNLANADDANVLGYAKTTTAGIYSTEDFVLSANTPLTVSGVTTNDGKVNQSAEFDYIIVRKIYTFTEVVGNSDKTTTERGAKSSDIVMKPGDIYNVKFCNYGSNAENKNNFIVMINNTASMYADWYDYMLGKGGWADDGGFRNPSLSVTDPYQASTDGGTTSGNLVWANYGYVRNSFVDLTIKYKNGAVTVEGTATSIEDPNYIYYYGYSYTVADASADATVNLSVCLSWLGIVSVEKTAVGATIGATGWTTFASTYPLNLSSITASEGTATAYYAYTAKGSSVTMTSTTATVRAGEGLALKGTAGATVTIPVAASGTAIDGNKLKGCTTSTALAANSNYYVLVNNNNTAEFQRLDTNGATIPAGKAYLDLTGVTLAPTLSIVFEDETSGIDEVRSQKEGVKGAYFNLAGQRVAQPTKGLYIVNGRKVVIK